MSESKLEPKACCQHTYRGYAATVERLQKKVDELNKRASEFDQALWEIEGLARHYAEKNWR